jgi:thiamine biosynthesis protein ThiS
MIQVNGQEMNEIKGKNLKDFLCERGYYLERIVVEYNGEIIPKESLQEIKILDGDTIEVLNFVGGG